MVCVVEVIPLIGSVEVVHVYVQVIGRLSQVILALVQGQADTRGRELFSLGGTSLQG